MEAMTQLPIPAHFRAERVGEVWRVPYQDRATEAKAWAERHQLQSADQDQIRICLLGIDIQNTFCIPDFELFVGGRSGMGAVEDNQRLCQFIYRYLDRLTTIALTMDTHTAAQIFHPVFWVDSAGNHPAAMTLISLDDVEQGRWQANPAVAPTMSPASGLSSPQRLQQYALHYVRQLHQQGKYPLTIWPYHSMLGGIGHAIVSAVEEASFFHSIARRTQTHFELKGNHSLTENYSVLKPEVLHDQEQIAIAEENTAFLHKLLEFDAILIAGQAKSHCVAWTIDDLLTYVQKTDPALAHKVYLLEDCTSPVVVPDVIDFTDSADATFQRFAAAGMHLVKSTELMDNWLK